MREKWERIVKVQEAKVKGNQMQSQVLSTETNVLCRTIMYAIEVSRNTYLLLTYCSLLNVYYVTYVFIAYCFYFLHVFATVFA